MDKNLTVISKAVVCLIGLAVLSLLVILLPEMFREEAASNPGVHRVVDPYYVGAWILATPVFIALYHTNKLLTYAARNQVLSAQSIRSLQIIKVCAIAFGILIMLSAAAMIIASQIPTPTDDTPPIAMFGTILALVAVTIAIFVGVLQRLLQNAIDIKTENDLTV
jgi:hypothetical protein